MTATTELIRGALARALGEPLGCDDDFFARGGDSLAAMAALSELQQSLGLRLAAASLMEHPTATRLAEAVESGAALHDQPIPEARPTAAATATAAEPAAEPDDDEEDEPDTRVAASLVQQAVLLMSPHKPSRGFLSWVYQVNGDLDVEALAFAVDDVRRRFEVLRSRFERRGDDIVVVADPFLPGGLEVDDLTAGSGTGGAGIHDRATSKRARIELAHAKAAAEFESLSPWIEPRLRCHLWVVAPRTHVIAMFVAEALVDADSGTLVAAEISRTYAHRAGLPEPADLPRASASSYLDHLRHLGKIPARPNGAEPRPARAYTTQLGAWPTRRLARPSSSSRRWDTTRWGAVTSAARRMRTTPYVVVLSGLEVALARLAGATELPVTSVVVDRSNPETRGMIGSFHSVVRLQASVDPDEPLDHVVGRNAEAVRACLAESAVPMPLALARQQAPAPFRPPPPGVEMYMFENREALVLAGVRQRRFRLGSSVEALRLNCTPTADGGRAFHLASATAPPQLLDELADELTSILASSRQPAVTGA